MLTINGAASRIDAAVDLALAEKRVVGAVVLVSEEEAASMHKRPVSPTVPVNADAPRRDLPAIVIDETDRCRDGPAMIEQGILHFDDPVTRWLPILNPSSPTAVRPRSARHLLTHTAGLGYGFFQPPRERLSPPECVDGMDAPGRLLDDNLSRLASAPLASHRARAGLIHWRSMSSVA